MRLQNFAERLKELTEINEISVKKLSQDTEIHISSVYHFINGKYIPSFKNAVKIANYFNCSLDYMFGFVDDPGHSLCYGGSINDRVNQVIYNSGLTRYKIHKNTGISEQLLSRWYNGKQTPTLISLVILADELECSLDYLAGSET